MARASAGAPLERLRLAYFPDEPERPGEPGAGRPTGSTRITQRGQGCSSTVEDRCGAFLLGNAGDLRPVHFSCNKTVLAEAPAPATTLLAKLRTSILRRGRARADKLKRESVTEVATLDIDEDGQMDRVLLAAFDVVATRDNLSVYNEPPRCAALLLEAGPAVIPVSEDACKAPGTSERLLQAFKLEGLEGIVLHIARHGPESQGAFLVHVVRGRSVVLPLPPCDGNG